MLTFLHRFSAAHGLYGALAATSLCGGMVAARCLYSGKALFLFLLWNLALAWVPFVCSLLLLPAAQLKRPRLRWLIVGVLGAGWLAFLPNAPYLLTDLLHLQPRAPVPYWFDASMLGMFACTGLLLGIRSLQQVHGLVEAWAGRLAGWVFAAQVTMLCGLGIYIGRFLRWNSWDLATRPEVVLADLAARLLHPAQHPRTWGATLMFGLCMLALYATSARPSTEPLPR